MELYLLLSLAKLNTLFIFITIMSGLAAPLLLCGALANEAEKCEWMAKLLRRRALLAAVVFVISGVLGALCPTRVDIAIMYGWDAINSDTVQEVVEILKKRIIEK